MPPTTGTKEHEDSNATRWQQVIANASIFVICGQSTQTPPLQQDTAAQTKDLRVPGSVMQCALLSCATLPCFHKDPYCDVT